MTDDEHENLMYNIYVSYTAEDIGEITGEEGSIYWHPNIDGTRIESCVNLDIQYPYFRYIRSISDDEYGKICRIRLDKPEYIIHKGDIILTKQERDKLIQILNSTRTFNTESNKPMWDCIILEDWMNHLWYGGDQNKPIIPPMPDYSKLETSD